MRAAAVLRRPVAVNNQLGRAVIVWIPADLDIPAVQLPVLRRVSFRTT